MHDSFFPRTRLVRVLALIGLLILSGCSTARPWQNRGAQPGTIRTQESALQATNPPPSIVVVVALSGGGSRAAAFGLGVLQEMNATHFSWEGKPTNLLERLSAISGVSGGSVLAAYYAAFGAEGLNEFEADFLLKDVQGDLISQAFSSATAYRLTSPWFGRSNAFAEQLDKLYKGKTYGDVAGRKGAPELLIVATDLTTGAPFEFSPEQFRLICSDLSSVPLAFAVASSSAVPFLLTPTSLRKRAARRKGPSKSDETVPARTRTVRR
jgi:NTE family protein